jgi:heat shock protein HslJ
MLFVMLALVLAGGHAQVPASPTDAWTTPTPAQLSAWHWQLHTATDARGQRIGALFARSQSPLELVFQDQHLNVKHACNAMGGDYRLDGNRLQLNALIHTMMACVDPAENALDHAIGSRLHAQPQLAWQQTDTVPRLRLRTDDGDTLIFVGAHP